MKVTWQSRSVVVLVASCIAAGVGAQVTGPSSGGRAGAGRGGSLLDLPNPRPANPNNFYELVNLRIAQLEEDLNLTNAQLPAWNLYKDRLTQMRDDLRRGARVSASETTAPKQLDGLADISRNRLTAVEDIVDAGKALYAVLTPEQKAIADRRLVLPLATLTGNDSGTEVRRTPRPGSEPPAKDAPVPPPK
jgi:hypothetical protein